MAAIKKLQFKLGSMKKKTKVTLIVIFLVLFHVTATPIYDWCNVLFFKNAPVFAHCSMPADDGGSGYYAGLGYRIEITNGNLISGSFRVRSAELYLFGQLVAQFEYPE